MQVFVHAYLCLLACIYIVCRQKNRARRRLRAAVRGDDAEFGRLRAAVRADYEKKREKSRIFGEKSARNISVFQDFFVPLYVIR